MFSGVCFWIVGCRCVETELILHVGLASVALLSTHISSFSPAGLLGVCVCQPQTGRKCPVPSSPRGFLCFLPLDWGSWWASLSRSWCQQDALHLAATELSSSGRWATGLSRELCFQLVEGFCHKGVLSPAECSSHLLTQPAPSPSPCGRGELRHLRATPCLVRTPLCTAPLSAHWDLAVLLA